MGESFHFFRDAVLKSHQTGPFSGPCFFLSSRFLPRWQVSIPRILGPFFPPFLVEILRMNRETEVARIGLAVAVALKARRETLKMSKNALSQKAGVSFQSVSFIEGAVNSPSLSTFLRLCRALEVAPDSLLRDAIGKEVR